MLQRAVRKQSFIFLFFSPHQHQNAGTDPAVPPSPARFLAATPAPAPAALVLGTSRLWDPAWARNGHGGFRALSRKRGAAGSEGRGSPGRQREQRGFHASPEQRHHRGMPSPAARPTAVPQSSAGDEAHSQPGSSSGGLLRL